MNVFVTGGAGFIGSALTRVLLEEGHGVTVLDDLSKGFRDLVPEGARFIEGDVRDERLPEWLRGHDAVIHMAAFIEVGRSVLEPVLFAENNVVNSVRLLEAMHRRTSARSCSRRARRYTARRSRCQSARRTRSARSPTPTARRRSRRRRSSPSYNQLYGMDAIVLRYFNPYGPNELHEPETHAIPNFIKAALRKERIPLHWNGEQVRDFIYVDDLARAHTAVLGETGLQYYNVGSETGSKNHRRAARDRRHRRRGAGGRGPGRAGGRRARHLRLEREAREGDRLARAGVPARGAGAHGRVVQVAGVGTGTPESTIIAGMEPQIQFCTTADGVSIAYWTQGEGPPLVYLPPMPQHAQLDRQMDHIRTMYEWLAQRHRLIRIDPRNTGLSQRGVEDLSAQAREADVTAVADRLGIAEFAIFGHGSGAGTALACAAHYPARVRRLILLNSSGVLRGVSRTPAVRALTELLPYDWETFTETLSGVVWGWAAGDEARRYAALLRASWNWEDAKRPGSLTIDVTDLLPLVTARTLVIHHREAIATAFESGQRLAAGIADARLLSLEGRGVAVGYNDPVMMSAVDAFLDEAEASTTAPPAALRRAAGGTVTMLFTDIAGHTEMMRRLGDDAGRAVLREHERITRDVLKEHGGDELKTMGDGFMASFASSSSALRCAVELQRAFAAHNDAAAEPIVVRVGLNAGEPIDEDSDLFGASVILAARVAAHASGGEILVPEPVRHLVTGKEFLFSDRGDVLLKGFEDAVRLYEVRWRE